MKLAFEGSGLLGRLTRSFDWSKRHVFSTHLCWGAQAGLYYRYGIEKGSSSVEAKAITGYSDRPESPEPFDAWF